MTNDSSTGGYVTPNALPAVPDEDAALDKIMHDALVGMTGIGGTLVRPRWQPEPPALPANTIDWIAFGVYNEEGDTFAFVGHTHGTAYPQGADVMQRNEVIEFLVSAYGPNAGRTAKLVRDGFSVAQNREALWAVKANIVNVGGARKVPAQVNNIWYQRVDLSVFVRREIIRTYPILDLLSAQATIKADVDPVLTVPVEVNNT